MRLPKRAIHLDFHTMPAVDDVGANFDADDFAAALADARVDFITVFATCNLGMAYYPTKIGVVHPSLQQDLFGQMVQACHKKDIAVAAYFNAGLDHESAQQHRDWAILDRDGSVIKGDRTLNFYRSMCFGGPWPDHLTSIVDEVLTNYEVDGVFLDCFVWGKGCYGDECLSTMRDQGMDMHDHEAVVAFQNDRKLEFVRRIRQLIDRKRPEATYYLNGVPYKFQRDIASHLDIESLPAGGWGYIDFPWKVRRLRNYVDHLVRLTGRFHESWGDFGGLRTQAGLDFDCFQAVSQGTACGVGDHMHPRGQLDKPVYERIGSIFKRIEALDPWTADAKAVTEIAAVVPGLDESNPDPGAEDRAVWGITRALEELNQQFDILDPDADWAGYCMLLLVDPLRLDNANLAKLRNHLSAGGSILATGSAGLLAEQDAFPDEWGLNYAGSAGLNPGFFLTRQPLDPAIPDMPVMFASQAVDVRPGTDTEVLADVIGPYFNRHWDGFHGHFYTPPKKPTGGAAVTRCGQVIHIAFSLFRDYARAANPAHRGLLAAAMERLLPDPLVIATGLPSFARVTLTAQSDRTMVHLLSYVPELRGQVMEMVEEPIVLHHVHLSVRRAEAKRVYLAPAEQDIHFEQANGRVEFDVPEVAGYQMIVIE